jgi:putative oxidoreductase
LNFIPPPSTPLPEGAMAFLGALVQSGYLMQLIAVTHLQVGALLVLNRFVPLALVLFAPFIVNSLAFHVFLERSGLPMAIVFLALELYLAWVYRHAYRLMLVARVNRAEGVAAVTRT